MTLTRVVLFGRNGTPLTYDQLTEADINALDRLVQAMASPTLQSDSEESLIQSARNGNLAAQHSCERKGISWRSELATV